MRIRTFADGLRTHDVSVAIALLELVRRADDHGRLDRGEWLAAISAEFRRLTGGGLLGTAGDEVSEDELLHYVEQNILTRLSSERLADAYPPGEAWEEVRVAAEVWREVEGVTGGWASTVEYLDNTVRKLLITGERRPDISDRPRRVVEGGSTLTARGLVKAYRKRKVVNDVDISVSQGEIVGLLGPNGAGKTTTFYMIVGLISPDVGKVFLDDSELTKVPMFKRARRGLGYLAQEPSIFRKLTVEQNILAILETMNLTRAEKKYRLGKLLDELGLKHLRSAKAYSLSGGERRRLEITRALVSDPKFMLLDEPFAGVDPIAVHDIQQIVAGLRHRGIGVVITDHNVEQTLDIVDRAYIMYEGRVRVSGTVAELVWNDEVAEIYFGPTLTARMRERYGPPDNPPAIAV
jgi:lipopolysaccharide export system ATP-binding protein